MPRELMPDSLDDFVNSVLPNIKRGKWVDISLEFQEYHVARLFKKNKLKEKGGTKLTWRAQVRNNQNARDSEMFAVDRTGVKDLTTKAEQNWSKQVVDYEYDIDEEEFASGDSVMIINELKVREHSMFNDYFEHQEEAFWRGALSNTQRPRPMTGVPNWIPKNVTMGKDFAHAGGNPDGFSGGIGGINTDDVPTWKSGAGGYQKITREDLMRTWKKAARFTKFKAVHDFSQLDKNEQRFGYYTTYRVVGPLEEYLDKRNDNLGPDLAKYAGKVLFASNPVEYVPYLEENDDDDPIYGIDWNALTYFCKAGRDMMLLPVKQSAHQSTVRERRMIHWGNTVAWNRRRLFVLSKIAA